MLNSTQTQNLGLCYLHRNINRKLDWLEEYKYSRFLVWAYLLIFGYPISIVSHVFACFMEIFGYEPKILENFTNYTLLTQMSPDRVYIRRDNPIEQAIIGIVKLIVGVCILAFAFLVGIFGAIEIARKMQDFNVSLFYKTVDDDSPMEGSLSQNPIEIAKMRYAKGEISKDEYNRLMNDLGDKSNIQTSEPNDIECISCSALNPKGSQFCITCGSALPTK